MEGKDTGIINIDQFEILFRTNHQFLCMVAMGYVHDQFIAEDMVQDFFADFWQRRSAIRLTSSFEAYARRAVKYKCIDFLRKNAVAAKSNAIQPFPEEAEELTDEPDPHELQHQRYLKIIKLIESLPESRRKIFIMHTVEKLSYAKIAEKQNISINTVKTQLSRAYTALRNKTYLLFLGFLLILGRF